MAGGFLAELRQRGAQLAFVVATNGGNSHCPDCRSADALSPPLLIRLLMAEGGPAEMTEVSSTARRQGLRGSGHDPRPAPAAAPVSATQSVHQTWTVVQHGGPDHLGFIRQEMQNAARVLGGECITVQVANVEYAPTRRPSSPRIVFNAQCIIVHTANVDCAPPRWPSITSGCVQCPGEGVHVAQLDYEDGEPSRRRDCHVTASPSLLKRLTTAEGAAAE